MFLLTPPTPDQHTPFCSPCSLITFPFIYCSVLICISSHPCPLTPPPSVFVSLSLFLCFFPASFLSFLQSSSVAVSLSQGFPAASNTSWRWMTGQKDFSVMRDARDETQLLFLSLSLSVIHSNIDAATHSNPHFPSSFFPRTTERFCEDSHCVCVCVCKLSLSHRRTRAHCFSGWHRPDCSLTRLTGRSKVPPHTTLSVCVCVQVCVCFCSAEIKERSWISYSLPPDCKACLSSLLSLCPSTCQSNYPSASPHSSVFPSRPPGQRCSIASDYEAAQCRRDIWEVRSPKFIFFYLFIFFW